MVRRKESGKQRIRNKDHGNKDSNNNHENNEFENKNAHMFIGKIMIFLLDIISYIIINMIIYKVK